MYLVFYTEDLPSCLAVPTVLCLRCC